MYMGMAVLVELIVVGGTSSGASQCEHCARMPDINQIERMTCMSCNQEMSEVTVTQHVWKIGQNYIKLKGAWDLFASLQLF